MKKLAFMLSVGLLLTGGTNSDDVENSTSTNQSTGRLRAGDVNRHYYDYGGQVFGCVAPPISFLDDLVVTCKMSKSDFKLKVITAE